MARDVHSEKSKQLRGEISKSCKQIVHDRSSRAEALSGVHTVFAMIIPSIGPDAVEAEFEPGKMISDNAVKNAPSTSSSALCKQ
jgi:hypothetical protein